MITSGKTTIVETLSGFKFRARKWKLKDMEGLARAARTASAQDDLLVSAVQRTWVETIEPGPYAHIPVGDVGFDWKRIAKPDVLWALFRVRVASWPNDPERGITSEHYHFDVKCPHCQPSYTFKQMIVLSSLKVRPFPEESLERMRKNEPFTLTAPDGKVIAYRLPTLGQDELLIKHLARFKRKRDDADASELLAAQIDSISGLKGRDLATKIAYIANLEIDEFAAVRDGMSRSNAHIISRVDATCDVCKTRFQVKLPLEGSFFMPSDPMEESPEDPEPEDVTESSEEAD